MKIAQPFLGAGLVAALFAGSLQAEEILQPLWLTSASYESRFSEYVPLDDGPGAPPSASPSDVVPSDMVPSKPPAATEGPGGVAPAQSGPCPVCCQRRGRGWFDGCSLGDPWTMPQPCVLQHFGIRVGGWLEHGITFNADNVDNQFNGPVATNDLDHEYQMNQFWLYLDRPADTGGCGWAVGGHVDMLYGTDWRFGINHGLEDRINGFDYQTYGMVIPQMYAEFAVNNLSVKIGHFAAILDYEVIPAPLNPFYSHSYSYGYTVPQLVTGVLGEYKLSDRLSILAGFNRGWMMFEDFNDDLDFMGGIKWTSRDKRTSLAYAIDNGAQDPAGVQNRFVYSLVAQRQVTEKLRYVLVHNLGVQSNTLPGGGDAEWYGLNQYFLYTINPCWAANLRFEWLRDDDGVRVAGPGNIPGVRAWDGAGYAGSFYELTCGITWRPNANVVFRPEVRYDWYSGLPSTKPNNALPFNDGQATDQFLFGVDMIVTF